MTKTKLDGLSIRQYNYLMSPNSKTQTGKKDCNKKFLHFLKTIFVKLGRLAYAIAHRKWENNKSLAKHLIKHVQNPQTTDFTKPDELFNKIIRNIGKKETRDQLQRDYDNAKKRGSSANDLDAGSEDFQEEANRLLNIRINDDEADDTAPAPTSQAAPAQSPPAAQPAPVPAAQAEPPVDQPAQTPVSAPAPQATSPQTPAAQPAPTLQAPPVATTTSTWSPAQEEEAEGLIEQGLTEEEANTIVTDAPSKSISGHVHLGDNPTVSTDMTGQAYSIGQNALTEAQKAALGHLEAQGWDPVLAEMVVREQAGQIEAEANRPSKASQELTKFTPAPEEAESVVHPEVALTASVDVQEEVVPVATTTTTTTSTTLSLTPEQEAAVERLIAQGAERDHALIVVLGTPEGEIQAQGAAVDISMLNADQLTRLKNLIQSEHIKLGKVYFEQDGNKIFVDYTGVEKIAEAIERVVTGFRSKDLPNWKVLFEAVLFGSVRLDDSRPPSTIICDYGPVNEDYSAVPPLDEIVSAEEFQMHASSFSKLLKEKVFSFRVDRKNQSEFPVESLKSNCSKEKPKKFLESTFAKNFRAAYGPFNEETLLKLYPEQDALIRSLKLASGSPAQQELVYIKFVMFSMFLSADFINNVKEPTRAMLEGIVTESGERVYSVLPSGKIVASIDPNWKGLKLIQTNTLLSKGDNRVVCGFKSSIAASVSNSKTKTMLFGDLVIDSCMPGEIDELTDLTDQNGSLAIKNYRRQTLFEKIVPDEMTSLQYHQTVGYLDSNPYEMSPELRKQLEICRDGLDILAHYGVAPKDSGNIQQTIATELAEAVKNLLSREAEGEFKVLPNEIELRLLAETRLFFKKFKEEHESEIVQESADAVLNLTSSYFEEAAKAESWSDSIAALPDNIKNYIRNINEHDNRDVNEVKSSNYIRRMETLKNRRVVSSLPRLKKILEKEIGDPRTLDGLNQARDKFKDVLAELRRLSENPGTKALAGSLSKILYSEMEYYDDNQRLLGLYFPRGIPSEGSVSERLAQVMEGMTNASASLSTSPFNRWAKSIRDAINDMGLQTGFCPLEDGNPAQKMEKVKIGERVVQFLGMGSPTRQPRGEAATIDPIFEMYLESLAPEDVHLYISNQNRMNAGENVRNELIMQLNNKYPGKFIGITLSKNSHLYEGVGPSDPAEYKELINNLFDDPHSGCWMPDALKERTAEFRRELTNQIYTEVFKSKPELTKEDRKLFIDLYYQLLTAKIIEDYRVTKANMTCKDGIDRGMNSLAGFLNIVLGAQGLGESESGFKILTEALFTRAWRARKRPPIGSRVARFLEDREHLKACLGTEYQATLQRLFGKNVEVMSRLPAL